MMTAHVAYTALDPSGVEATRSRLIMTDLLRQEMGFKGVVISDSLLMEGAAHQGEHPGERAAALLRAGIDILLDIKDVPDTVDYLTMMVTSGQLDQKVIDTALARIWSLKTRFAARFGPGAFIDPSLAQPLSVIACDEHLALARTIASASIQSASEAPPKLKPTRLGKKGTACVLVRPHTTYNDPTAAPLKTAFLDAFQDGDYFEVLPDTQDDELEDLKETLGGFTNVVVAVIVKPAAWHKFGLLPAQSAFISDISELNNVVLIALGSPIVLADFPNVAASICAYSDVEPSMLAVVDYLKGHESTPLNAAYTHNPDIA